VISSIIDIVLLSALAATSGCVLLMYRRLQRFDALQGEAAREFARSAEALDKAREAMMALQADGGDMTATLAARLNEARIVMNDIDEATARTSAAFGPAAPEAPRETEARGSKPEPAREPVAPARRIREAARARARWAKGADTGTPEEPGTGSQDREGKGRSAPQRPAPITPSAAPLAQTPAAATASGQDAAGAAGSCVIPDASMPAVVAAATPATTQQIVGPHVFADTLEVAPGAVRAVTWTDLARTVEPAA